MNATITTPHGTLNATVDADQYDLVGTGYIRLTVDGESNCWDLSVVAVDPATVVGRGVLINDADNGETYLARIVRADRATDPRLLLVTLAHPRVHDGASFQIPVTPTQVV